MVNSETVKPGSGISATGFWRAEVAGLSARSKVRFIEARLVPCEERQFQGLQPGVISLVAPLTDARCSSLTYTCNGLTLKLRRDVNVTPKVQIDVRINHRP